MTSSMQWRRTATTLLLTCAGVAQAGTARFDCKEGFDDMGSLAARGWLVQNNSDPLGLGSWSQGDPMIFDAQDGGADSYALVGADSASGVFPVVVSNWLITPEIDFDPRQSIRIFNFYTRAIAGHANRLVVRLCVKEGGESCRAPGPGADDLGGFQTVLLDINPAMTTHGYPDQWTWFSPAGVSLIAGGRVRIAFQYELVAQPDGSYGTHVGLDSISLAGASTCPFDEVVFANGFD